MKIFTTFLSLFIACNISFGQVVISNGEDTGLNWWQAGSTAVEIVDWHPKEGNPSAKAMTIWISPTSDAWSGGGLSNLNIDATTNNKLSVLVFKNVAGTVRLELQDGTSNFFTSANYTTPGAWQKLEFAVPSGITTIKTLLIAPFIDYNLSTIVGEQSRCFWDDVVAFHSSVTGITNPEAEMQDVVKVTVFNQAGIRLGEYKNVNEIPSTTLTPGLYIIKKLSSTGSESTEKKIITNRL